MKASMESLPAKASIEVILDVILQIINVIEAILNLFRDIGGSN